MAKTTPRENALEGVILNLRRDLTQAKQQMAQLSDDLEEQKIIAGNWKFRAATALTRLAEFAKQEPVDAIKLSDMERYQEYLNGDHSNTDCVVKLYAAAGASPVQPNFCESCAMGLSTCDCVTPRPVFVNQLPSAQPSQVGALSDKEIRKWWASENTLEDMDLCKIDDFTTTVRAIEKLINAKGATT